MVSREVVSGAEASDDMRVLGAGDVAWDPRSSPSSPPPEDVYPVDVAT
jgi:hypothetical protein